jgi:uncharacterized membrane protein
MKFWKLVLLVFAGLVLVVVLTVLLQNFVRMVIVIPVSYVLWLGKLFIQSVPQSVCWAILLVIAVVFIYKSLTQRSTKRKEGATSKTWNTKRSRMAFWLFQLRRLSSSSTGRFRESVDHLALDVVSHTYRIQPREAENRIISGQIESPAVLKQYLQSSKQQVPSWESTISRWWQEINRWIKSRINSNSSADASTVEQELLEIIEYLEDQLEIHEEYRLSNSGQEIPVKPKSQSGVTQ